MAPDFVGRERAIFSGNNCCKVRTKREETVERPDFARVKLECHHIRAGVAVSFHYGAFRQVFTVAYLSAAVDKSDRPIQDELLTVRGHTAPGEAPAVGWGCTVEHTLFQLTRPDAGPFEGRTEGPNPFQPDLSQIISRYGWPAPPPADGRLPREPPASARRSVG